MFSYIGVKAGDPPAKIGLNFNSPSVKNAMPVSGFMDIFDEVETFQKGAFILSIGSGLVKDVKMEQTGVKSVLPPLTLMMEKAYWKNIGIGLKAGFRWWKIDKLDFHYRYYTLALRGTYHFNLLDKLDPYAGIATTVRLVTFTGNKPGDNEWDFDPIVFVTGARYFLTNWLGAYLEYAPDGQVNFHGGLVFKLK